LRVEAAAEQAARDAEIDAAIARGEISGGESSEEEEAEEVCEFYCKACNKAFNSAGAKTQHFNSKKHEQRMWYLKKNGLLHLLESEEEEEAGSSDDDLSVEELSSSDEGADSDASFDSADDAGQDEEPLAEDTSAPTGRTLDGLDSIPTPGGAAWGEETATPEEASADLNFDSLWVRFSCGRVTVNKKTVPKSYYWHSESEKMTLIPPAEGVMDVVEVSQDEFSSVYEEAKKQDGKVHRGGRANADATADESEASEEEEEEEEELPPPGLSAKERKKWLKRQERLRRNAGSAEKQTGDDAPKQSKEPEPEPEPEPETSAESETEARIAALKRQLKKLDQLRELQMDGMTLDANQLENLKAEHSLRQALDALEKGEQRCFDCGGDGKIGKGKRQKKCSACQGSGVIKLKTDAAAGEAAAPASPPVRLTKKQLRQKQQAEREAAAAAKAAKQDFNLHGRQKPYSKAPKSKQKNPLKSAVMYDDDEDEEEQGAAVQDEVQPRGSGDGSSYGGRDPDDMPPMGLTNKERKAWLKRQEKAARRAERSGGTAASPSAGAGASDIAAGFGLKTGVRTGEDQDESDGDDGEAGASTAAAAEDQEEGAEDEQQDGEPDASVDGGGGGATPSSPMTKREKRRAKQKAKSEAEKSGTAAEGASGSATGGGGFMCDVCFAQFPSKSKVRYTACR
jgi:hypothetical protein